MITALQLALGYDRKEHDESVLLDMLSPNTESSNALGAHIRGHVNFIWKLWNIDFEAALDLAQDFLISFARDERDGNTLGSETTSTALK
jgi:hypothetical protein